VRFDAAIARLKPMRRERPPPPTPGGPVLVATDGWEESYAALNAARFVAYKGGRPLEVAGPRAIAATASRLVSQLVVLGAAPHASRSAVGVLRAAACPVLLVAPELICPAETILAAIDFGAASIHAARTAMTLLDECGCLTLLHVLAPMNLDQAHSTPRNTLAERWARERLERVRGELSRFLPAGGDIELRVETGPVLETILRCASEKRASVIALGTHGPWSVRHLLLGSTAAAVLHTSPVSVLVSPRPVRLTAPAGGVYRR
jgi:nucleotide-binding universal stress UspA family protein